MEQIKLKLYKALSMDNRDQKLKELNLCLELCDQQEEELENKEFSCYNYYYQYQQTKELNKLRNCIMLYF
jgi:hypothetical protein